MCLTILEPSISLPEFFLPHHGALNWKDIPRSLVNPRKCLRELSTVGQTSWKYSGNLRKRENYDWSTKKPPEIWWTFSWNFKSLRALHLSTAQTLFSAGGPVNRWDLCLALASLWLFPRTNQKLCMQMTSTLAQDRINCRSREKGEGQVAPSLAGIHLTDGPIRSERKDVVNQVTNPRASSLQPPMSKNLVQVLSALLIHSGAPLFCGGVHGANIREHAQLTWASPICPTRWVSWRTLEGPHACMHACIMESCRNVHRVLSLRGNFRFGQQSMGRAQLHIWSYLGLVYREYIPNTQHVTQT